MKFRPLHDRVLIKVLDSEEKTSGGIIIPDTAKEKPQEGEVVAVGSGAKTEDGKIIKMDVKVGDKVTIKSFCDIEFTKIGNSTVIGPFARLRGDTVIDNNAKIGNFVEVKKSKINHDVKISHLSYVGDSIIEKNTNIGAGTITCNFDGFNKNKTYIGENCFIGSNTSLIAPIKIKKNSVIGAGTVIDKNVQEGSVVYRKSKLIKKDKK